MEEHQARTQQLAERVRSFHERKLPFRVYHGSTTSTRRTIYDPDQSVDTSTFDHVLSVDSEKRRALVEPNVSMAKLVDATLPHGLVPAVVPEFTSITVGGCFAGTGGESSSFKQGLFDDTITRVEIILADGRTINASEDENTDLFHGAAGSFGTLGVFTMLEVQLMEVSRLVALEYHPVTDAASAVRKIEQLQDDPTVQYLDGILFSADSGVIMAGRFADDKSDGKKVYTFHRRGDNWFYLHVQKKLQQYLDTHPEQHNTNSTDRRASGTTDGSYEHVEKPTQAQPLYSELLPIRDYLFRYDRACFWMAAESFRYFYIHNRAFQRWLLHSLCTPPKLMHAGHRSGLINQYIVQDVSLPYRHIPDFVSTLQTETGIYPLWLCPLKLKRQWPLRPRDPTIPDRILNIGLWGRGSKKLSEFVEQNRRLEERIKELHGLKCLYAQVFYTEEEFWQLYDREGYQALREKYGAQTLPDVYAKVGKNSAIEELERRKGSTKERLKGHVKDVWIFRGLYGTASMILGREYLLKKKK